MSKRNAVKWFGVGVMASLLAVGGTALARGGHGGGPLGLGGPGMKEVIASLDLDDSQKALLKEMRANAEADREGHEAFRESARETLLTQLAVEKPDSRKLHGLVDEGFERAADSMHARLDDFLDFHATLSAEQRSTLVEELEARAEERDETRDELRERHGERGSREDGF